MAFCGPCQGIFLGQTVSLDKNYDHHQTWHSFLAAADQGCPVCWRKWDALSLDHRASLRHLGAIWDQDLAARYATTIRFTMDSAGCLYMAFWPESARLAYTPVYDRHECPDARYFFRRRLRTLAFVPSGKLLTGCGGCHGMNSSSVPGLLTGSQSKGMDTLLPSKRRIRPQHPPGGLYSPG